MVGLVLGLCRAGPWVVVVVLVRVAGLVEARVGIGLQYKAVYNSVLDVDSRVR